MIPELSHRTVTDVTVDPSTRQLHVQLARWNDVRDVMSPEGYALREALAPGSVELAPVVEIVDEHDGHLIGAAQVDSFRDDGDGPTVWAVVASGHTRGSDAMALVDAMVTRAVSMEFERIEPPPEADAVAAAELAVGGPGLVVRQHIRVHRIALTTRPAHDAPILAVRSTQEQHTMNTPNPNQIPPQQPAQVQQPAPAAAAQPVPDVAVRSEPFQAQPEHRQALVEQARADQAAVDAARAAGAANFGMELPTSDALVQRSIEDSVRRQLLEMQQPATSEQPVPGASFRSVGEHFMHVSDPSYDPKTLAHRAIADQISDNNPGVTSRTWLQAIVGIIERARPTVTSFGTGATPSDSKTIDWPALDPTFDWNAAVGEQLAELDEVTSVRVDILDVNTALRTFAGGSRISYQLLRKSSPPYRDAYMRIMNIAYALAVNGAMVADVEAAAIANGAGSYLAFDWATPGASNDLRKAIFRASTMINTETGAPAQFALAGTDVFVECAGFADVFPRQYGTQNVTGEFDATQLAVSVAGLPVRHDPQLAVDSFKVSNDLAATWREEGPFPAASEDVHHLGQNVAVWGMGATELAISKGIVSIETTQPI